MRVFNIWEERGIYDSKLVSELKELLNNAGPAETSESEIVVSSFQVLILVLSNINLVCINISLY